MTAKQFTEAEMRAYAASMMGSVRSERKAAAARENGKLGGRPRKSTKKRGRKPVSK